MTLMDLTDATPLGKRSVASILRNYAYHHPTAPYVIAVLIAMFAVLIRIPLNPWIGPTRAAFLVPLCAVAFMAVSYGFVPALITEIVSLVAVVFFAMPPAFSFKVLGEDVQANLITSSIGAFACAIVGHFVYRSRHARDELALQLQQTVANAGTGLTRCSPDLRYVMVNPAFASFVGKAVEEVVGQRMGDVLGEEAMPMIMPYIDRVLRGEKFGYQIEIPIANRGNRTFSVHYSPERDGDGMVIGWIASVDDITDRKTAEITHARLAAIVDSSHDAIISKNLDTIITSWNTGAERLFGYTAEEAVGKSVRLLIPDDRQDEESEIIGRIGQGESIDHYETVRRRKDGTLVDISLTVSPIRNNGIIIGASKIARDITPQKLAEKRIAADLTAMTRLRTIGSMTSSVDCDVELCLDAILDAAIDFTHGSKGNIQVMRPDTDILEIAFQSGFREPFLKFFEEVEAGLDSVCGAALRKSQRVIVEDITKSDIFLGRPALDVLLEEDIRAVQSTPLVSSKGQPLGMISTHFSEPHRPGERELGLLDLLARQTADMLERRVAQRVLEQEVAERTRELNEALASLVAGSEV